MGKTRTSGCIICGIMCLERVSIPCRSDTTVVVVAGPGFQKRGGGNMSKSFWVPYAYMFVIYFYCWKNPQFTFFVIAWDVEILFYFIKVESPPLHTDYNLLFYCFPWNALNNKPWLTKLYNNRLSRYDQSEKKNAWNCWQLCWKQISLSQLFIKTLQW
jgi:hypothetical protein